MILLGCFFFVRSLHTMFGFFVLMLSVQMGNVFSVLHTQHVKFDIWTLLVCEKETLLCCQQQQQQESIEKSHLKPAKAMMPLYLDADACLFREPAVTATINGTTTNKIV